MTYKEIINKVSQELDIPSSTVEKTYKAFWRYIKDTIESLPLKEDLTEEEFCKLQTNFNIPSLGKLSCTYPRYVNMKKMYNTAKKYKKQADDKAKEN